MTRALRTSLLLSPLIILTTVVVNLITSPGYLWCIYPVLGVLWWPVSAYFAGRRQPLRYALCGFALLFGLFFLTYLISSPGAHPWFVYPLLAAGWWPLSVWGAHKGARVFAQAATAYIIATVLLVNLLTSPGFWWWVYPAFFVLWWPLSVRLGERARTMSFATGSATAAFLFLVVMHRIQSPHALPWYLFALLPLFWWPISKVLLPRVGHARLTLISVIAFAAYYTALSGLLYAMSNLVAVFALGAAAWITYAVGISKYRDSAGFAALNAILLAGYFILMHRLVTPGAHAWYWYTFFPLVWWVYAAALGKKAFRPRPLVMSAMAMLLYYAALNRFLSPGAPWSLFLVGPAALAVIGSVFAGKRKPFAFSVWASAAIIAQVWLVNLVFTPRVIWAVYPTFALLWWPLSLWLHVSRTNAKE